MSGYANEGFAAGESGESAHNNNTKMKAADETIVRRVFASLYLYVEPHLISVAELEQLING